MNKVIVDDKFNLIPAYSLIKGQLGIIHAPEGEETKYDGWVLL